MRNEIEGANGDEGLAGAFDAARTAAEDAERHMLAAEAAHVEARRLEAETRAPLQEAERKAQSLATEAQTVAKLLTARAQAVGRLSSKRSASPRATRLP